MWHALSRSSHSDCPRWGQQTQNLWRHNRPANITMWNLKRPLRVPKTVCFICFDKWTALQALEADHGVGQCPILGYLLLRALYEEHQQLIQRYFRSTLFFWSRKKDTNWGFVCGFVDHGSVFSGTGCHGASKTSNLSTLISLSMQQVGWSCVFQENTTAFFKIPSHSTPMFVAVSI